jgi:hypothetical protein
MKRFSRSIVDLLAALSGTIALAINVPWHLVFSATIPGGGDNPSHPVLMRDVGEALLQHGSIIHYSYSFWGGFELFQFYFSLPYIVGGLLMQVMPWQIAFKIVTLLGTLLLPPAFYVMARGIGWSRITACLASFISVNFLHTEAHVMWGANVSSTLAGMIGNSWGIVFLCVGIGALFNARRTNRFSPLSVLMILCAGMCHFYALLMLGVSFFLWATLDIVALLRRKVSVRHLVPFYLNGAVGVSLLSWWAFPLLYYSKFSTDFGGNWAVELLSTFTDYELYAGIAGLTVMIASLVYTRARDQVACWIAGFALLFVAAFYAGEYLDTTAVVNIRIWPSIYLALYLVILYGVNTLTSRLPIPLAACALLLGLVLRPTEAVELKARAWMEWNFSGMERKPATKDFFAIAEALNKEPAGQRVTFESSDGNNGLIGSVRALEMLPLVTKQQIVEGGILNSATFPGVGYSIQCLVSNSCAGWPNGSSMAAKDMLRGVAMMRALGITYHIAQKPENIEALIKTEAFDILYAGTFHTLLKLKQPSSLLEVYDEAPPVIKAAVPHITLLNLWRTDALVQSLYVFDSPWAPLPKLFGPVVNGLQLFNFMEQEQRAGRRGKDLGYHERVAPQGAHYLNNYIVTRSHKISLEQALEGAPDFMVNERSFSTDLVFSNVQRRNSGLYLPLVRTTEGDGVVLFYGDGYRIFHEGRELFYNTQENNTQVTIPFVKRTIGGVEAPFALIEFKLDITKPYNYVETMTYDTEIQARFPGDGAFPHVKRITDQCSPTLERTFHKMILRTACPGKPHLIKQNYYPKWTAASPIALGPYGYMVVTPETEELVIEHKAKTIDIIGQVVTCIGLITALILAFVCNVRRSHE